VTTQPSSQGPTARQAPPPRRVTGRRVLFTLLLLAAVASALGVAYLRRDVRPAIREVAGRLSRVEILESWHTPGSTVRRVELINDRGEGVTSAYLRIPSRLADRPRVLVCYTGHRTGSRILDLVPERSDLVVVAPQYPEVSDPEGTVEKLRWLAALRETAMRTVAGGLLALTELQRQGLEVNRTVTLGASLGGAFATLHAALDPRVTRLVLVHTGGDFWQVLRRLQRGRPVRSFFLALLGEVLVDDFDPVRYVGAVAPRPVLVIATRQDRYFPMSSIQALYDHAGHPRELVWTNGRHVSSGGGASVEEVIGAIEAYLDAPPPTSR
jgi:hypothetical protein